MDQQTPALYSVIQARIDMGECLARTEELRLEGRTISVAGCWVQCGWLFELEVPQSCSPPSPNLPCVLALELRTPVDKIVWEARLLRDEDLLFSAS